MVRQMANYIQIDTFESLDIDNFIDHFENSQRMVGSIESRDVGNIP